MASPINAALDRLYRDKITAVTLAMAKRSTLVAVLPGTATQCTNCLWDATNQTSSGNYNGSGPKPFVNKTCPVCNGRGRLVQDRSLTVEGNVRWGKADKIGNEIISLGQILKGYALIKVLSRDRDVIEKATHFMVDGVRCIRVGEPRNRGLQSYVITEFMVKRED